MKKLLRACCVFGALLSFGSSAAQAIDFKAKGMWDFNFEWQKSSFNKHGDGQSHFYPRQRLRTQIDIIASENLKGVVYFELGKTLWGKGDDGASLGTDGKIVKLRYSYVDWVIPCTMVQVRMGLQPFILPGYVSGSTILDGDAAGVTVSAAITENVAASLFWSRPEHNNYYTNNKNVLKDFNKSTIDLLGLVIPVSLDNFKITPWGMYGLVGKKSIFGPTQGDIQDLRAGMLPALGPLGYNWGPQNPFGVLPSKRGNAWWAGLTAEYGGASPLHIAVDANYGSFKMGNIGDATFNNVTKTFKVKRSGWYAGLLTEYKLEYITPGVIFWYASGDNSNAFNGSKRLPTLIGNWSATSFGYSGTYGIGKDGVLGNTLVGTWAVVLQLKDICFLENLSHTIRGAWINGTNSKKMPKNIDLDFATSIRDTKGGDTMLYLTTKDYAWEIDFDSEYKIYKDLTMVLELSFIRLELDKKVWSTVSKNHDKNAYRAGLNMRYSF